MNAVPGRRPAVRTLALAAGLTLALTGCGAGLDPQTYQARIAADSTNVSFGTLEVRDLSITAPEGEGSATHPRGGDVSATLVVVNTGDRSDRLVSASSPIASDVVALNGAGRTTTLVVPARGVVSDVVLELQGLTREIRTGEFLPLELTFERGGRELLMVPVELTGVPGPAREGYEVAETDSNGDVVVHGEEGEEHSEEGGEEHSGEDKAEGDRAEGAELTETEAEG